MTSLLALLASFATAADCESIARRAQTTTGTAAVSAWAALSKCDAAMAEARFPDFMRATKDVDSLVALSFTAMDAGQHRPLFPMLEQISDYAAREETARTAGESCEGHKVVDYLTAAYADAKDRQFTSWQSLMTRCPSADVAAWVAATAAKPPPQMISDKYAAVLDTYRRQAKVEALPTLQAAAIQAAKAGPFGAIVAAMAEAVRPEGLGGTVAPDDHKRLVEALVAVAKAVDPAHAREVAERLYQANAIDSAVSLLPSVYPDRVAQGGGFLYGVAALETCDGAAIAHYALVREPGTRWAIQTDVEAPARAFKPKLKCDSGTWAVAASTEPLTGGSSSLTPWVEALAAKWGQEKSVEVELKAEKDVVLP